MVWPGLQHPSTVRVPLTYVMRVHQDSEEGRSSASPCAYMQSDASLWQRPLSKNLHGRVLNARHMYIEWPYCAHLLQNFLE